MADTSKIMKPMMAGIGAVLVLSVTYDILTSSISGVTHDDYGEGVEGVTVSLDGASVVTGSDGAFSIRTMFGSHTISFSKTGYYTISRTIEVPQLSNLVLAMPMVETLIDPTGTILCLPMSAGIGAYAIDVSGYANDGVFGGGNPDRVPRWETLASGKRVLRFGVDGLINCGHHPSLDAASGITIAARVYMREFPVGEYEAILKKLNNSDLDFGLCYALVMNYSDSRIRPRLTTVDGNNMNILSTAHLAIETWYTIVFTYSAAAHRARIYIDGVLDIEDITSITGDIVTSEQDLIVGAWNDVGGWSLPGYTDWVRVYSRELSAGDCVLL